MNKPRIERGPLKNYLRKGIYLQVIHSILILNLVNSIKRTQGCDIHFKTSLKRKGSTLVVRQPICDIILSMGVAADLRHQ